MFANLQEHFQYSKFGKTPFKALVINSGYFLLKEFSQAMVEKGHKVRQIQLYENLPQHPFFKPEKLQAKDNFLEEFILTAAEFKPDFIFTVNMIGFDIEGSFLQLLESLNLTVLNWFVDTPFGILIDEVKADYANILSLCWEKSFIKPFRSRFIKHKIEYMPYATMLTGREKLLNPEFENAIAFVGSSMFYAVETWRQTAQITTVLEKAFIDFSSDKLYQLPDALACFFLEFKINEMQQQTFFYFLGSKLFRESMVTELNSENNFAVYGDSDWQKTGIKNLKLFPSLNYYRETPQLFFNTAINVNITSPQMATAVNQRVFDIPGAGGFLLTDYRADLMELFDEGDVAFFKNEQELRDSANFYLSHDNLRREKAEKLKKYVLANHRYTNRLESIFAFLRKMY